MANAGTLTVSIPCPNANAGCEHTIAVEFAPIKPSKPGVLTLEPVDQDATNAAIIEHLRTGCVVAMS